MGLGEEIVGCREGTEVRFGTHVATAQGVTVAQFLDVAQSYGHTLIAVGVESVEGNGDSAIAARVDLGTVQNRCDGSINHLGRVLGVGVEEVVPGVSFIVSFGIAIAQRQLERTPWRELATELADASLQSFLNGCLDSFDGGGVRFGDEQGERVLGV